MQFLFAPLWGRLVGPDRSAAGVADRSCRIGGVLFPVRADHARREQRADFWHESAVLAILITRIGAGIAGATISHRPSLHCRLPPRKPTAARGWQSSARRSASASPLDPCSGAASLLVCQTEETGPERMAGISRRGPCPRDCVRISRSFDAAGIAERFRVTPQVDAAPFSIPGQHSKSHSHDRISAPFWSAVFLTTFAFAQFETTLSLLTKTAGPNGSGHELPHVRIHRFHPDRSRSGRDSCGD